MTASRDAADRARPMAVHARRTAQPLWRIGLTAASVASAANVVVYVVARAAGVPLELTEVFADDFERIPASSFVLATLLEGGVTATAVAAICRKWASRPRASFVALAVIGTIASLGLPIASDGTTATVVVLSISHIVAALVIVPALALALPPRSPTADPQPPQPGARIDACEPT
jgi:Family of unknown function (DUF6069)